MSYRWLWDSMNAARVLPLAPYKSDRPGLADAALRDAVALIRKQQQVPAAAAAAALPRGGRQPLQLLSANPAATTTDTGCGEGALLAGSGQPKSEKRPRELQQPAAPGFGPDEFTFDVPLVAGRGAPAPSPKLYPAAPPQLQLFGSAGKAAEEQGQECKQEVGDADAEGKEDADEDIIAETQAHPHSPSASSCKGPPAVAAAATGVAAEAIHPEPQPVAAASSSSPSLEVGLSALGGTETISIAGGAGCDAVDCGDGGGDNRTPTSGVSLDEPYVTRRGGGGGGGASSHVPPMRPMRLQQRLDDMSPCSSSCRAGSLGTASISPAAAAAGYEACEACDEASGEVCTPVGRPGGRGGGGAAQHGGQAGDADVVDLLTPTGVMPGGALGPADGGVLLPPGRPHGAAAEKAAASSAAVSSAASQGSAGAAAVLYSGFDPPLAAVATVRKRLVRNDQRQGSQQREQVQQEQAQQPRGHHVQARRRGREGAAWEEELEDELEDSDVEAPVQEPVLQRPAQEQQLEEALEDQLEDEELQQPNPEPLPPAPQSQRRRLRQGPGASALRGSVEAGLGSGPGRGAEEDLAMEAAVRRGPALLAAAAAPPPRPSLANSSVSVGSLRSLWQQRQEESRAAGAVAQSRRPQLAGHRHQQGPARERGVEEEEKEEEEEQGRQDAQQACSSATMAQPPARRPVQHKPQPSAATHMPNQQPHQQPQRQQQQQPQQQPHQHQPQEATAATAWHGVRIKPDPGAAAEDEALPLGPPAGLTARAPPLPPDGLRVPAIKPEPEAGGKRPGASERRRAAALATSSLVLEPESLAARPGVHGGGAADDVAAKASRRRHRRAAVAAAFQATPTPEDIGLGPDDVEGDVNNGGGGGAGDGDGDGDGESGYESAADLDAVLAESQSNAGEHTGGAASTAAAGGLRAGGGAFGGEVSTPPGYGAGAGMLVGEVVVEPGAAAVAGPGRLGPQAGPATINRMLTLRTGGLTPLPAAQRRPLMPRIDW